MLLELCSKSEGTWCNSSHTIPCMLSRPAGRRRPQRCRKLLRGAACRPSIIAMNVDAAPAWPAASLAAPAGRLAAGQPAPALMPGTMLSVSSTQPQPFQVQIIYHKFSTRLPTPTLLLRVLFGVVVLSMCTLLHLFER